MVTFVPNALNMLANSTPTWLPPMTTRLSGSSSSSRMSSVVSTPGRSRPSMGSRADSEPVAMIIFLAAISVLFTLTRRGDASLPMPLCRLTLFALISCSTPDTRVSTTFLLRSIIRGKFALTLPISTPNSSALLASRKISALLTSAFVGIQPWLRHVPPSLSFSIRATSAPRWAA